MRWEVACSAMEDEAAAITAAVQRLEVARAAETARRILAYDGHASGYSRSKLPKPPPHAPAPASATEYSPPSPYFRASQDVSPSYTPAAPPLPVSSPPRTGAFSFSNPGSFAAIPPHVAELLSAGQLDAAGRVHVQLSAEDLAELRKAADGMSTWSPITGVEQDTRMPNAPGYVDARMREPLQPSYSAHDAKLLRSPVTGALKKAATTKQSPLAPASSAFGHALGSRGGRPLSTWHGSLATPDGWRTLSPYRDAALCASEALPPGGSPK